MPFNKRHISFGFTTLSPKRRLAQNLRKYTFFVCVAFFSKLPSIRTQPDAITSSELYVVANCVIAELGNITVKQEDPHTAERQDLQDWVKRVIL